MVDSAILTDKRATYLDTRRRWSQKAAPVWGTDDCVCFAADMIKNLTGRDIIAELGLPRWHSAVSATHALADRFGQGATLNDSVRAAAEALRFRRVYALMAQTGDLCLIKAPIYQGDHAGSVVLAPGIIDTGGACAAITRLAGIPGLLPVAQPFVIRAWRID